ncbi:hypothetical protein SAMN06295879_2538 [Agreia bicolorata]|uniref:Uncharacterized protein n=1 Tax=Agreia bicolorata TaxID=110935 RepID=A0A1T4Y939_9MICO|nr:hypothetical protein [Agreia bicolorata]SKA98210.1 hypothetical protein SAMN06295879_2538 [Agreia bicolorata]
MEQAAYGARAVEDWMSQHSAEIGWRPLSGGHSGAFDLGPDSSHAAVLQHVDDEWCLQLDTAKGRSLPVLGPVDSPLEVLLDALMFAIYMRATAEVDRADRTASAQLSLLLRRLAEATNDARYGGRASLLLAGHAVKDDHPVEARSRAEDAIRLFGIARDLTAQETARTVLADLPRLMSRQER